MQNPFIEKLNWHIEKPLPDPVGINDRERRVARPESVSVEQLPIPMKPPAVEETRQRFEQRPPDAEIGRTPRPGLPAHPSLPATASPLPVKLPTIEELRQKAQQCRADATSYTIPELRAN